MPELPQHSNIFISYRREDAAGHAGRLFDRIKSYFGNSVDIFMDVDSIAPGEDFIDVIKNAVDSCEILIAVIGKDWLNITNSAGQRRLDNPNDFVRTEIATALERNIRVIPVLVQDAFMPTQEQLPEALARLSRRNAIELSDRRWQYDTDELNKTIENILRPQAESREIVRQPPKEKQNAWTRSQKIAALAVVVVIASLITALIATLINGLPSGNTNTNTANVKVNKNSNLNNEQVSNTSTPENNSSSVNNSSEPTINNQSQIQVVRVIQANFRAQGFFTPKGYILAFGVDNLKVGDQVTVSWSDQIKTYDETASIVKVSKNVVLLRLNKIGLRPGYCPIRLSSSLQKGETVERFIREDDKTPGKVLEVNAQNKMSGFSALLVTTRISFGGDAGAPVIDSNGRIVAMVLGASQAETYSMPIEVIKINFFEAF